MPPNAFKQWRQKLGLTQEEAASRFAVSRVTIQNWEKGATTIPKMAESHWQRIERDLRKRPGYGPVRLFVTSGPMEGGDNLRPIVEECPDNETAIQRVMTLKPRSLTIITDAADDRAGDTIWNSIELDNEVRRREREQARGAVESTGEGWVDDLLEIARQYREHMGSDSPLTDNDLYDEIGLPK